MEGGKATGESLVRNVRKTHGWRQELNCSGRDCWEEERLENAVWAGAKEMSMRWARVEQARQAAVDGR